MTERTPGFWLGGAALVIVLVAIAGGLFVIGGPGDARLERLDRERTDDLRRIEQAIAEAWRRADALPASLDTLRSINRVMPDDLIDPTTSEPYEYRVLSDSTYELCATFDRPSDEATIAYEWTGVGDHDAGLNCFTIHPMRDR